MISGDYITPVSSQGIQRDERLVSYLFSLTLRVRTPGIWGPKGCGKSFNIELCCKKLNIQPIIVSAGELEDGTAGEPGKVRHQSQETRGDIPGVDPIADD